MHERHRSLYPSPWRSRGQLRKCPKRKEVKHNRTVELDTARHRVGLERPHFCTRFRGQSASWVAPAQVFGKKRAAGRRGRRVAHFETAQVNGDRSKTRVAHSSARVYCLDGGNRVIRKR